MKKIVLIAALAGICVSGLSAAEARHYGGGSRHVQASHHHFGRSPRHVHGGGPTRPKACQRRLVMRQCVKWVCQGGVGHGCPGRTCVQWGKFVRTPGAPWPAHC